MSRRCRDQSGEMQACARRMLEGTCARLLTRAPDGPERAELLRCVGALQRLDDGSWGTCQSCAAAIGRNRLLAIPEATTCARCEAAAGVAGSEDGAAGLVRGEEAGAGRDGRRVG